MNEPKYGDYPKHWSGGEPITFVAHLEGYDVWVYRDYYKEGNRNKYSLRSGPATRALVERGYRVTPDEGMPKVPPHIIDYLKAYDKLIS